MKLSRRDWMKAALAFPALVGAAESSKATLKIKRVDPYILKFGNRGGYVLSRAPDEISLYDILMAVEGQCLHLSGNFEGRSGRRLKLVWDEIGASLVKKTQGYTLDQLASKQQAEMYYI